MDPQAHKKASPPSFLSNIIWQLTPRYYRANLQARLAEHYTNVPEYLLEATDGLRRTTVARASDAFNPLRLAGDICCLYIPFSMAPFLPVTAIVIAAVIGLTWSDAHSYPSVSWRGDNLVDAIVLAVAILISQIALALIAPSATLDPRQLLVHLPVAMAMVSGWRVVSRMNAPAPNPSVTSYRQIMRSNLLWMCAAYGLSVANTQMVHVWHAAFMLMYTVPTALFAIDLRLRSDAIGGIYKEGLITPGGDPDELKAKRNRLLLPLLKGASTFWWARWVEPMFFVALAGPAVGVIAAVMARRLRPEEVNWLVLVANLAASIALSRIWLDLKKANARLALQLEQEIRESQVK